MSEEKIKPFTIRLNRCTESDYKAFEMRTNPQKRIYTPQQEFEQLKAFKGAADFRIRRQRSLISKIKRGKFKLSTPGNQEKIRALAEHDLKSLNKLDKELQQRTVELRRKIHEETINCSRFTPDDTLMNSA
jgi:hypothetical protein